MIPFSKRCLKGILRSLAHNRDGNIAVTGAIAIAATVSAVGVTVEYSSAVRMKSIMQSVVDSAALGGASSSTDLSEQISNANDLFAANMKKSFGEDFEEYYSVTKSINHDADGRLVASASAQMNYGFLKLYHVEKLTVSVQASAQRDQTIPPVPICFMAMHETRKHTLEMKDSVSLYGPDCHIYGNSNHPYDVVDPHTSENYVTSASIQAIGYGHHYLENLDPPLVRSSEVINDPYAAMTLPVASSACDYGDIKYSGGSHTLAPGTYCGKFELKKGANVTLEPGIHIFTDEKFKIDNATLTGTNVAVMFDGNVEMEIKKGAVIRLGGRQGPPFESFVMMATRESSTHAFEDSTIDLNGIVYMPDHDIEWENAGEPALTSPWAAWIVDGVSWTGSGVINFPYDTDEGDVPFPRSDLSVIPGTLAATNVRLLN